MTTANERLASVKSLMRWLWRSEAIDSLPRVMGAGSQELEIGKSQGGIQIFSCEEIAAMLNGASRRTRLYILLTLNTAMTQKDIADLMSSEVDWELGRIVRKRSKTRKFDATPVVSYKLWSETFKLLQLERNSKTEGRVLTNRNGSPLWTEGVDSEGRYQKIDNVRSAYERLRRKLAIQKPFKCLKKTSATELAGSNEYRSLRGLFLGHAPREMSDRHYAQASTELLDEALLWLRLQLGIDRLRAAVAASR